MAALRPAKSDKIVSENVAPNPKGSKPKPDGAALKKYRKKKGC